MGVSEMIVGISTDIQKMCMDIAPTVFAVKSFDSSKKTKYTEGKEKIVETIDKKFGCFLLPSGDRFTKSGITYGEIHVFCLLYCHGGGAFPEILEGKLAKFYKRMSEVPGIKKVIDGKSQFGQLATYLIPVPH